MDVLLTNVAYDIAIGAIQAEAHKVLHQSDSTQTIDHNQKIFRQKFHCSRRPSYWTTLFFNGGGAEAMSRSTLLF